jgi:hypothetical protein
MMEAMRLGFGHANLTNDIVTGLAAAEPSDI